MNWAADMLSHLSPNSFQLVWDWVPFQSRQLNQLILDLSKFGEIINVASLEKITAKTY